MKFRTVSFFNTDGSYKTNSYFANVLYACFILEHCTYVYIAKALRERLVSKIFQLRFLKLSKIVCAKYSLNKEQKKNLTDKVLSFFLRFLSI